ncbi:MAG: YfhO family protein [Chloroflexi bacterium]|nr:YfhO family protein [Chloroflexota bacterium]
MLAGFFWRIIYAGDAFVPAGGGDLSAFLYPNFVFAASSLKQGILPLWNPYLYGGSPFAADIQSGLFYPINLLVFYLLPEITYQTMEFLAILHFYIAGVAMYSCLRFLRTTEGRHVGRAGALTGAVAYMLSDVFIVHLGHLNMIAVAAWLPLIFLFFQRGLVDRKARMGALAGIFLGVALLAGHIQPFLYILLCLALYFVFHLVAELRSGPRPLTAIWRLLAVFAVFAVVAVGVSAIQLIPSFELSHLSVRAKITYATSVQYSLTPAHLVSLFVPGFFGRGPEAYWGPWMRTEMGYAGVLTLVAGLVAVVLRRRRETFFFLALAVVGLSLALGGHSLTQGWLFLLGGGFDMVRAPARFLFLFDFALAALAGLGVDRLLWPLTHDERASLRGIAKYLNLFAVAVAAGALPSFLYLLIQSTTTGGPIMARLAGIVEGLTLLILLFAGCIALLWARIKDWAAPAFLGVLAVVWIAFDLMTTGFNVEVATSDPTVNFRHPGVINFLKQDQSLYRLDSVTDVWDVWQPSTTLLSDVPDIWGIWNPMLNADLDNYWAKLGGRSNALYDLMNAKYVVGHKGVPLDKKKFELVYDDDPQVSVFRNNKALPRAFAVYNAAPVASKDEAFAAIHDKAFDPAHKVLVEGGQPLSSDLPMSNVDFSQYSLNHMALKASVSAPAYLVLSEIYDEGWKAWVDGQPQKILRADYLFRAIPLSPGDHEVRLVYDPPSFRKGATISGLTWLGLIGALGVSVARRRRGQVA